MLNEKQYKTVGNMKKKKVLICSFHKYVGKHAYFGQ